MSAIEILDKLKFLTDAERLLVIETASRLMREQKQNSQPEAAAEDPVLAVIGSLSGESLSSTEIDDELYGQTG